MKMGRISDLLRRKEPIGRLPAGSTRTGTWGADYSGPFVDAIRRTARLGLFRERVVFTDRRHFSDPAALPAFLKFANAKYASVFSHGLEFTAPIVHSGLVTPLEEFFS